MERLPHPDNHTELTDDGRITHIIEEALREDLGIGDVTTDAVVPSDATGHAHLLLKESGIPAGLDVACAVFQLTDPEIVFKQRISDGAWTEKGTVLAGISGPLGGILKGERTALNFLQRMSGIATITRQFVQAVEGTSARITDTRKTAPGLRLLDKLAVGIGGGVNHRFGLDDMVLIKDNHIDAVGGIGKAIERCTTFLRERSLQIRIEVEARTIADVTEALATGGIHRIMLDNFTFDAMREAVQLIDHRVEVEASGNVNLATVRPIAETGVDFISVGALTHSVKALDISLDVVPSQRPSK